MNKHTFKSVILNANTIALDTFKKNEIIEQVARHLHIEESDVQLVLKRIEELKGLEWLGEELDFMPITMMYAKSYANSPIEALCALALIKPYLLLHGGDFTKLPLSVSSILDTTCFHEIKDAYSKEIEDILSSQEFIPFCLQVLYVKEIHNLQIPLKNKEAKMEEYAHVDYILSQIQEAGIPVNRDASKDVATFFKDTLMHEFDRCCPLCGINLPHMLIASHIKPFRDCAHIYEAGDYHNGILLCKNHDYLFDQGYISFEEDGNLLISSKLPGEISCYALKNLGAKYLSETRRKFLKYHREHIFLK
ncbi:MAG: HNH endonuclease [Firmicutes bacterium]|nr:HNH endonuclease [Bacillota bacterium]